MKKLLFIVVSTLIFCPIALGQISINLFRQYTGIDVFTQQEFIEAGLQSSNMSNMSQEEAIATLQEYYREGLRQSTEAKVEELKQFKLLVDEINRQKRNALFGNLAQVGLAMLGGVSEGVAEARAEKENEQQRELEQRQYQQQQEQQWASQQNSNPTSQNYNSGNNSYLQQQQYEQQKAAIRQQVEKEYPMTSSNASTYGRVVELEVQRRMSAGSVSSVNGSNVSQSRTSSRKVSGTLYYTVDGTEYTESIMLNVSDEGNRKYVSSYQLPKRLSNSVSPDGDVVPVGNYAEETSFNIDGFKANNHQWKIQVALDREALRTSFAYIYF